MAQPSNPKAKASGVTAGGDLGDDLFSRTLPIGTGFWTELKDPRISGWAFPGLLWNQAGILSAWTSLVGKSFGMRWFGWTKQFLLLIQLVQRSPHLLGDTDHASAKQSTLSYRRLLPAHSFATGTCLLSSWLPETESLLCEIASPVLQSICRFRGEKNGYLFLLPLILLSS